MHHARHRAGGVGQDARGDPVEPGHVDDATASSRCRSRRRTAACRRTAIVDTISLGTPIGSARIAAVAIAVPPTPPAAEHAVAAALRRAARGRRRGAARLIAPTAAPRSPAAAQRREVGAAGRGHLARAGRPAATGRGRRVPTSTTSTAQPGVLDHAGGGTRTPAPFVSSVPTSTTVGSWAHSRTTSRAPARAADHGNYRRADRAEATSGRSRPASSLDAVSPVCCHP